MYCVLTTCRGLHNMCRHFIIPDSLRATKNTVYCIKCDHCDWKDMSVDTNNYDQWLNRACEQCGHNLLTEHDYKFVKLLEKLSGVINVIWLPVMLLRSFTKLVLGVSAPKVTFNEYEVKMDGVSQPKMVLKK